MPILIFSPHFNKILVSRKRQHFMFIQLEVKLILETLEFSTELKF